jgi:glucan 1,3-beta-glucosidase
VIVGNEVLLRGEMSAPDLARTIREVKSQVTMPVTYADVWEFWLRHRDIAAAVDFITIHILPYWEDLPIPVRDAPAHVDAIRRRIVAAFPGKDILVGEFGWPSAGRMREGALPSPVSQARVVQEVIALASRERFRVNLIEAYDQSWKRRLEGTVGGHWGLYDGYSRQPKFAWGGTVSDHPHWRWQAAGGAALALIVIVAAFTARRGNGPVDRRTWVRIAVIAFASGATIGWTIENVPLQSLTWLDWVRSLAWASVAALSPIAVATALVRGERAATFAQIIGRPAKRPPGRLGPVLAGLLMLLSILAVQAALGLVLDPRYRDFPFAPLTGAAVPFALLASWRRGPRTPAAEKAFAATLAVAAVYISLNEGISNWQAVWCSIGFMVLALTLRQARGAPG